MQCAWKSGSPCPPPPCVHEWRAIIVWRAHGPVSSHRRGCVPGFCACRRRFVTLVRNPRLAPAALSFGSAGAATASGHAGAAGAGAVGAAGSGVGMTIRPAVSSFFSTSSPKPRKSATALMISGMSVVCVWSDVMAAAYLHTYWTAVFLKRTPLPKKRRSFHC